MMIARYTFMKRILPLLLIVCCLLSGCQAKPQETPEDFPVVTVNGEDLFFNEYYAIESAYLAQYEAAGIDLSDEATSAYLQDLAMTYAVEQMLVKQDMRAQGCFTFDKETENWLQQTGTEAYNNALNDVKNSILASQPDMSAADLDAYSLAYAKSLNVTVDTYVDYYRTQYAAQQYYAWLIKDNPITDADIQAAYETRVAESQSIFANDAAAFETALYNGQEAWYRPDGYRAVLQILLPAEGDTNEARLQSVQTTVDTIATRLNNGESFQALMGEYSQDANSTNADFLATGYQVHRDSVVWENAFILSAFSDTMSAPGAVSQPFVSDLGVHILYYLADVPGGPIELTNELRDALHYTLYTQRYTQAQQERLNTLAETAEVIFH